MRIAIVGGGGAGLTTAWLLEGEHQVTLYEKQDRLGGHAHTINLEVAGEQVSIDAGFEFISRNPTLNYISLWEEANARWDVL